MTITLSRTQYKILNPPAPTRWQIAITVAGIVAVALLWAVI